MSLTGVSVQIDLTGEPAQVLKDLTRIRLQSLLLRHCHGPDFPLTRDSEAVYSTKALWRSTLAVIIQRPAAPLLTPWTEGMRGQEEHWDISHSGSKRLPGEGEKGRY